VELAAEITDGWIPVFFSVERWQEAWGEHVEAGLAKGGRTRDGFSVSPSIQMAIDGDLDAARGMIKAGLLLYIGGMGSKETNFYADLTRRFGFAEVADEVQSLYLEGKREQAYAAIPDELVDATALVGTEEEVATRVKAFAESGVDRLIVSPMHGDMEQNVSALEKLAQMVGVGSPA
jgi:alkanesulfonate monooxygenase SsuD/methylene tetrahydromethanopterin reductase-like flavin-dependent oxidoreductase (luciferase family)